MGDVTEDGISLIGSLATIQNHKFKVHLEDFWKYLQYSFKKENECSLFKTSIQAVSDIAKSTGQNYNPYLELTMNFLMNCLNKSLDRSIKVMVFDCFGRLCFGAGV